MLLHVTLLSMASLSRTSAREKNGLNKNFEIEIAPSCFKASRNTNRQSIKTYPLIILTIDFYIGSKMQTLLTHSPLVTCKVQVT